MKTDIVVAGYLIHDGKVLLIHHRKLDLWLPPGGHIEKDEIPDDALVREFKEEVNIDIEILNRNDMPEGGNMLRQLALPFYANVHYFKNMKDRSDDHHHCCFYYICRPKDVGKLKVNIEEGHEARWFSEKDLEKGHVPADVRHQAKKAFEIYKSL